VQNVLCAVVLPQEKYFHQHICIADITAPRFAFVPADTCKHSGGKDASDCEQIIIFYQKCVFQKLDAGANLIF
jgi:hypothetical protein